MEVGGEGGGGGRVPLAAAPLCSRCLSAPAARPCPHTRSPALSSHSTGGRRSRRGGGAPARAGEAGGSAPFPPPSPPRPAPVRAAAARASAANLQHRGQRRCGGRGGEAAGARAGAGGSTHTPPHTHTKIVSKVGYLSPRCVPSPPEGRAGRRTLPPACRAPRVRAAFGRGRGSITRRFLSLTAGDVSLDGKLKCKNTPPKKKKTNHKPPKTKTLKFF